MTEASYEVLIVGGGPAGLSAALMLGRCRRRVLVCDAGQPRNAASHGLHGFLTRDGIKPSEFLEIARQQLQPYHTVALRRTEVTSVRHLPNGFELTLSNGESVSGRKLLLATGVVDELPAIDRMDDFYGRSVFHCPYCDGWEVRDQPLAVYGNGENGAGLSLELKLWSSDVVLCSDGPSQLTGEETERLAVNGIEIRENKIDHLEGKDGVLEFIVFTDGERFQRRAMFFSTGQNQSSNLAKQLGCEFTDDGCVATGEYEATSVPGLFAAGDASKLVQFVIVAAAEGAQAAVAINKELIKEDLA